MDLCIDNKDSVLIVHVIGCNYYISIWEDESYNQIKLTRAQYLQLVYLGYGIPDLIDLNAYKDELIGGNMKEPNEIPISMDGWSTEQLEEMEHNRKEARKLYKFYNNT